MFDDMLEKIKQIFASRLIPIFIILVVLFTLLVNKLFEIQIIEGQKNKEVTSSLQDTRLVSTGATRGLIRAADGEILAGNELVYTVELYDVLSSNEEKNAMISYLIETLKEYNNEIEISFPLYYEAGKFHFSESGSALKTFKTNAFASGKLTEEEEKATAKEVFEYMRDDRFKVDEKYSIEETLEILSLRYAMYVVWPAHNPVLICSDVDEETVVAIKERSHKLKGVNINKQSHRVYTEDNEPFSHILGYTGLITEGELENYNSENPEKYNSFDLVGKTGIEASFEEILSGQKGEMTIALDGNNKPTEVINSIEPTAGGDVYLTIDPDLQRAVYQLVEQNLSTILLSRINNSKDYGSRGESTSDIRIPIYDVYYAFINNEIIDTNHFKADDATQLEQEVYQTFLNNLENVLDKSELVLAVDSKQTSKDISEEMNEYISYIYELLNTNNVLIKDKVDKNDEIYIEYTKDKVSLSEYLQYALANNWIDLDKLGVDEEYYDTNELYNKLIEYIKDKLYEDKDFHKIIYYYLVDTYKLSGTEICLLLFDQGVLEYKEEDISKLKNGAISSYTFITAKILNLEITPDMLGLEPYSASVLVTDVKTGKLLSAVSYPSYDSNNYVDYLSNNLTSPLYPRVVKEAIAPGSTYKMVSAIAGLEENVITPYEKTTCEYVFTKTTPHARCHSRHHGSVNLPEALEVSCNYYFYELGYRLGFSSGNFNDNTGLEKLSHYSNLLGLGLGGTTNLEKEFATTANTSASKDSLVRSAIGQGSNIFTPAELSTYITTFANSGIRHDLTMIDKTYVDGKFIENEAEYKQLEEISASSIDYIQRGMYLVANGERSSIDYIFENLKEAGIEIAGKTGTSQISKNHANNALFVSYGPYDNPEISITVVIPNGHNSGNATKLAKDIYEYYFNIADEDELLSGTAEEGSADTPDISD